MNNQGIVQEIEDLLSQLKKQLNDSTENKFSPTKTKKKAKSKSMEGPASQIGGLITGGFFNTPKTSIDLWKEFKKRALNYDKDVIAVALMRAVKKGLLKRDGEGNTKNPWKYEKK